MENGENSENPPSKKRPISPINGQPVPNGRQKGTPNKVTTEFKQAVVNMLEYAAPHMVQWLNQVAEDSPERALELVNKMADYAFPKLARQENQALDKHGNPADNKVTVEIVRKTLTDT